MADYEVDQDGKFRKAIKKALSEINDLRIPFKLMAQAWFKGNTSLFPPGGSVTSSLKYADLSERYKTQKDRKFGFIYPVLRASGRLAASMTGLGGSESVVITEKTQLTLGTETPYANLLHFGTSKMPARPFVLIGGEQVAPAPINKRKELWIKTLEDYVIDSSRGFAK